jgi:hypothetical protein
LVQILRFGGLADAVSCPNVVQQEIAVGMNDRVAGKLRDFVRAAINARSGRQGFVGRNVADCAANVGKEFLSFQPIRSWLSGRMPTPDAPIYRRAKAEYAELRKN